MIKLNVKPSRQEEIFLFTVASMRRIWVVCVGKRMVREISTMGELIWTKRHVKFMRFLMKFAKVCLFLGKASEMQSGGAQALKFPFSQLTKFTNFSQILIWRPNNQKSECCQIKDAWNSISKIKFSLTCVLHRYQLSMPTISLSFKILNVNVWWTWRMKFPTGVKAIEPFALDKLELTF